ncbi:insulinase family protein [Streptomyces sp. NPDC001568]|uniref:insulinase family protein n=1 Tax=Streptomyces sp. NPDC001568 TaxID=3364588 RepID=UPI0036A9B4A0
MTGIGTRATGRTGPRRLTLRNGLRVLIDTTATPVGLTAVAVHYGVGFRSEPEGRAGVAHLLEHMMFEGSERHPGRAYFTALVAAGGSAEGTTHQDYTDYVHVVPTADLERALAAEADRMRAPLFTADSLAEQLAGVEAEIRAAVHDAPLGGLPWPLLPALLYNRWANSHDGYGDLPELARLTPGDCADFFRAHYAPGNAVLTVSGADDPDRVAALVTRHFAAVPARPASDTAPRPVLAEPPLATDRVGVHTVPGGGAVSLGYRLPDPATDLDGYLARLVVARLLAVPPVDAGCGFFGPLDALDPDTLVITLPAADEDGVREALRRVDDALRVLADAADAEVRQAAGRLAADHLRAHHAAGPRARALGRLEILLGDPALLDALPERLRTLDPDRVRAAAGALSADHRAVLALLPGGAPTPFRDLTAPPRPTPPAPLPGPAPTPGATTRPAVHTSGAPAPQPGAPGTPAPQPGAPGTPAPQPGAPGTPAPQPGAPGTPVPASGSTATQAAPTPEPTAPVLGAPAPPPAPTPPTSAAPAPEPEPEPEPRGFAPTSGLVPAPAPEPRDFAATPGPGPAPAPASEPGDSVPAPHSAATPGPAVAPEPAPRDFGPAPEPAPRDPAAGSVPDLAPLPAPAAAAPRLRAFGSAESGVGGGRAGGEPVVAAVRDARVPLVEFRLRLPAPPTAAPADRERLALVLADRWAARFPARGSVSTTVEGGAVLLDAWLPAPVPDPVVFADLLGVPPTAAELADAEPRARARMGGRVSSPTWLVEQALRQRLLAGGPAPGGSGSTPPPYAGGVELTAVGDLDPDAWVAAATAALRPGTAALTPPPGPAPAFPAATEGLALLTLPPALPATVAHLVWATPEPPPTGSFAARWLAVSVLGGGQPGARLAALRTPQAPYGFTSYAGRFGDHAGTGPLVRIHAQLPPDGAVEAAALIRAELRRTATEPPTAGEVDAARRYCAGQFARMPQSQSSFADQLSAWLATGRRTAELVGFPDALYGAPAAEVARDCARLFAQPAYAGVLAAPAADPAPSADPARSADPAAAALPAEETP